MSDSVERIVRDSADSSFNIRECRFKVSLLAFQSLEITLTGSDEVFDARDFCVSGANGIFRCTVNSQQILISYLFF